MATTIDDISTPKTLCTAHITRTPSDIKRAAMSSDIRSRGYSILTATLLALFIGMEVEHAGVDSGWAYGSSFLIVFGLMGCIQWIILPSAIVRQTSVWEMDLTLTTEEVLVAWRSGACRVPWTDLAKFRETELDIYFISRANRLAFAFPKRDLSSDMLRIFREHLPQKPTKTHPSSWSVARYSRGVRDGLLSIQTVFATYTPTLMNYEYLHRPTFIYGVLLGSSGVLYILYLTFN